MELDTLIRAAQHGDQEAFAEVVERFQHMAHTVAFERVGDRHLAEDVAQEAFVEAFLCLRQLQAPLAFPAWFRRILIKRADRMTRRVAAPLVPLDGAEIVATTLGPAEAAEQGELRTLVQAAVRLLPAGDQQVLNLYYLRGYPLGEIADVVGVSSSVLKKRLFDARRRLRRFVVQGAQPAPSQRRLPFALSVRFFLAVRTGDMARTAMLLDGNPDLVEARELPDEAEARMFGQVERAAFTALHRAAQMNHTEIMRLLLARGADCNARAQANETALHLAVLYTYPDAVRVLIAHGTQLELDGRNNRGLTALHIAVMRNRADLVALLLSAGADRACADENGRTPYNWAAIKNNPAIMTMLEPQALVIWHGETFAARRADPVQSPG